MRVKITLCIAVAFTLGLFGGVGAVDAQAPKIAVISTQEIIEGSAAGKEAIEGLRALQQQKEEEVRQKQQEIADLRNQLAEGRLSLAEEKLQDLQTQLETKAKELRRLQEDAGAELNKRQEEVLRGIEEKVMPIITQVGQENGYSMIFRKFDSGLVYVDDAVDITQMVIERLDQSMASGGSTGGGGQ